MRNCAYVHLSNIVTFIKNYNSLFSLVSVSNCILELILNILKYLSFCEYSLFANVICLEQVSKQNSSGPIQFQARISFTLGIKIELPFPLFQFN